MNSDLVKLFVWFKLPQKNNININVNIKEINQNIKFIAKIHDQILAKKYDFLVFRLLFLPYFPQHV